MLQHWRDAGLTSTTSHKLINDNNRGNYKQNVDQSAGNMENRKAKNPQYDEYDSYGPYHTEFLLQLSKFEVRPISIVLYERT